jgi:hypothetical protein
MRLAAVLASLTVAATHTALAADPPGTQATPANESSASVQAPVGAPTTDSPPATATSTSPPRSGTCTTQKEKQR